LAEILRRAGGMRRPPPIPDFGPPPGAFVVRGCFRTALALFLLAILFMLMIAGGVVMQLSSGYW
ncbi:MAG TPA: hypothetical protein VIL72_00800, partial [Beijerinckiaceae bacterium]